MNKTTRLKTAALPTPTTREAAEQLLGEIGQLQRRAGAIEIRMNDKLAEIKTQHEQEAAPLNEDIQRKLKALCAWAEVNRDNLLDGRGKTAKLASGEISWRQRPPSVRLSGAEAVIEMLKRMRLHDLIRSKEEVNKDAVLENPDRVKGIKGITVVTGVEDFVAKPYESELEIAEPITRLAA